MTLRTNLFSVVFATALSVPVVIAACSGDDGAPGASGAPGPVGERGPQGIPGPMPDAATPITNSACTTPCHTFNGVVDQWRFSAHSHPQENDVGPGVCGNCHSVDGLEQRVANNYVVAPDSGTPTNVAKGHINYLSRGRPTQITYAGTSAIGRIHCSTCHAFSSANDPHVVGRYAAGQAPLRVAGGIDDEAYIEKSSAVATEPQGTPLKYRAANTCIFCHKSRTDVRLAFGASNAIANTRFGPHQGPQSDLLSGKGAYEFAGETYGTARHSTIPDACVSCHMAPVAANGNVPDHTMKASIASCKTSGCHTSYTGTSFDIDNGQTSVREALTELQDLLDRAGLLTRSSEPPYAALSDEAKTDGQFHLDMSRPGSTPDGGNASLDAVRAGILYNYLLVARGRDFGAHNPRYTKQILFDSISRLKGSAPSSIRNRPSN